MIEASNMNIETARGPLDPDDEEFQQILAYSRDESLKNGDDNNNFVYSNSQEVLLESIDSLENSNKFQ